MATFKTLQAGSASHLRMTSQLAGAISGGLTVASVIVRVVHDMVRDAIADVIGKLTSKAAIMAVSLGTAAPWAVSSLAADVSSWATRLAKEVTNVVTSAKWTARCFSDTACLGFQAAFVKFRSSRSTSFGVRYPRAE